MKSFDTRTYSTSDFVEWDSTGTLVLSPKFQRRAVWSSKAKSYLIDTVLRGKPMPKVLITQTLVDGRTIRTVVDGQQRLRAILEFMNDGFPVQRTHNQEFGGRLYSELPENVRADFWQYEIGVDVLFDTELRDLLDIFSRLNTYSVKLNTTELLNASYLGSFKTAAHSLGHKYADYWLESRVLTNSQLSRMGDVEIAADLLSALLDDITSRKQIPIQYKKYDDDQESVDRAVDMFDLCMSFFGEVYGPEDLAETNFRRVHLFYSAYLSLANCLVGRPVLRGFDHSPGSGPNPARARVILDDISAQFDELAKGKVDPKSNPELADFVDASRRATTDQATRERRSLFIARRLA